MLVIPFCTIVVLCIIAEKWKIKKNLDLYSHLNNTLSEGTFPECFKTAKIIPIFKSGESYSTVNYRPISMLLLLLKILQKLMCARLDSYLKSNNILCRIQFCFRKKCKYFRRNYWIAWLCLFIVRQQAEHHCCTSRFFKSVRHS